MIFAVDTSVAVPLVMTAHSAHAQASAWARGKTLRIGGHAAVETYSVLTRLPGDARLSPDDAATLIDDNFGDPLALQGEDARSVHRELAARRVAGAAVYDGLVALAARAHSATLVTRDSRARATYEVMGVPFVILAAEPEG